MDIAWLDGTGGCSGATKESAEGSSERTKQALNEYKVLMRLLCVREDSQYVWREVGPAWRWGEVSGSLLQYGEVVVEASNPSPGNEGSQERMTGGEMSGRLHTIDGQQEEARLSSTINGPWRGESRR